MTLIRSTVVFFFLLETWQEGNVSRSVLRLAINSTHHLQVVVCTAHNPNVPDATKQDELVLSVQCMSLIIFLHIFINLPCQFVINFKNNLFKCLLPFIVRICCSIRCFEKLGVVLLFPKHASITQTFKSWKMFQVRNSTYFSFLKMFQKLVLA